MGPARSIITSLVLAANALTVAPAHVALAQSKTETDAVKYWIVFSDKDAGLGKGTAAVDPDFVSERALERRQLRGRPASRDLDVPVSPSYVETLRSVGVQPVVESRWINGVSATLTPSQRLAVENLAFVREVRPVARSVEESIEPASPIVAQHSGPQGLDFGSSYGQLQAINAIQNIENGLNGTGVMLGFLDTTTDTLNPALAHLANDGRIVAVRDFPAEAGLAQGGPGHGLYVSSVAIGFDPGNLIGACYGGQYIFATTEYGPAEINQEEDFFVAGMEWMERMGADIVNVSLGYSVFDEGQHSYTYEDMDGDTPITTRAADLAASLGVVVVTSAGNEGNTAWHYISSPADGDSVIAAGGSDYNFNPLNFSGYGPTYDGRIKPDVSAPGTGVRYANGSGGYSTGGGTSFSSPLIASVVCQMLQVNPNLNPIDVRSILRSTAHQSSNPDNRLGWGVINAEAAIAVSRNYSTTSVESDELPGEISALSVYPNPSVDVVYITAEVEANSRVEVGLFDILGRRVIAAQPDRVGSAMQAELIVRDLPSGTYLIRIRSTHVEIARPVVVTH